jgi:hypothetical protein
MFTRAGHPTVELNRAINQIESWRSWLTANRDYATRPRREHGLGLADISPTPSGLILIGRRESEGETEAVRRQYTNDLRIAIHTYDFLVDSLVAERPRKNRSFTSKDQVSSRSYQTNKSRRTKPVTGSDAVFELPINHLHKGLS